VLEADELFAFDRARFQRVGRRELRAALHDDDVALSSEGSEPLGQLADDSILERTQLGEIDFRFGETDAVAAHRQRIGDHLGRMQQRLRRNAADVEANASLRRVLLDQHHLQPKVCRPESSRIASGAAADGRDFRIELGRRDTLVHDC